MEPKLRDKLNFISLQKLFALFVFSASPVFSQVILESKIDDIFISEIREIPRGPTPNFTGNCEYFSVESQSSLAIEISKLGWMVTSEVEHGPFHFVSFAGSATSITSGMCFIEQTNIAIFKDNFLIALVYTGPNNSHELAALETNQKGAVSVISGGGVRYSSHEFEFRGNRITLDKEASSLVCGRHLVPQLSEYPILEARNQLAKYGWFPVDWESYLKTDAGKNSVKDDFYQNARLEYGLPEIETCSGTGVGYCSLIYQHDYAFLNVTTVGDIDGAQVLGFSSQCK